MRVGLEHRARLVCGRQVCGGVPVLFLCAYLSVWFGGICVGPGRVWARSDLGATNQQLVLSGGSQPSVLDPEWKVGAWIWSETVHDKQFCRFWRAFEVRSGAPVTAAVIRMTADNGFRLMLDGREIGRGSDWRSLTEFDVTRLLTPGRHVLAVEAFNDRLEAGLLFGMRIVYGDESTDEIASDESWWVVPLDARGWERRTRPEPRWSRVKVWGRLGSPPWVTKPYAVTVVPPIEPIRYRFWQRAWFQFLMLSVLGVTVLVSAALAWRLSLQSLSQRLLQRERDRIARDIHDGVGAELTQLILQGEVLKSQLGPDSPLRGRLEALCDRGRMIGRQLDEVVWAVNSRRDTLRDFITYVCKFAQAFFQDSPVRCRLLVECELTAAQFDLPVRRNLFLAIKEALNNVARHSGASEVELGFHRVGRKGLRVLVRDNGVGFDPAQVGTQRNGLTNMASRLREINGECRIWSEPGAGCAVEFVIPALEVRAPVRLGMAFGRFMCRNRTDSKTRSGAAGVPGGNETKDANAV